MKTESYTRQGWRDAFIATAINLGANADVADSVLRKLEEKESWTDLEQDDPALVACDEFNYCNSATHRLMKNYE